MSELKKWKIFCTTESIYRYIWDTSAPTQCPYNNGHTVNSSSVHDINLVNTYYETSVASLNTDGHNVYRLDAASNSVSLNLPAISTSSNRVIIVQRLTDNGNTVSLVPNGSDKINNVASNYALTGDKSNTASKTAFAKIHANTATSDWVILDITTSTGELNGLLEPSLQKDTDDPNNNKAYLGWNNTSKQWTGRQLSVSELEATANHIILGNGASGMTEIKYNMNATTAPVATDDGPDGGYSVGSVWHDTTNDKAYICLDNTNDAAVWKELTAGNVTGDVVGTTDTQTLTNKTFIDSSTFFADNSDVSKKLQFELSGITTSTTRTITIPDTNTTLVGTDSMQTLTNKTISGSSNTISNLTVAQGGTGATTLTGTLIGNGTSAITALKSEFAKTTAPVATDDGPDGGYSIGSLWYDTTNDKGYVCLDITDNAAVWKETTFVATAGDGIDIAANGTVSTDLKANGGLVIESTELAIDLSASSITGTLAAADGGTGQTSYTTGDLLYASGSTVISKLADIATGNALISGGVGTAPSYGKIGLTTHVSGTLPATSGGTDQSSYVVGDLLYASTTTALSKLADIATGNALISGGVGTAPSYGKIGLTTHVSGTLPVASGGTGATTFTSGNFLQGNGTSAVSASKTVPTGDVVGTTDTQTITNKTLGGNLDANSNKIINLATPTASTDSATKGYVDSVVSGLDVKNSVKLATTQDLDSNGSISGTITYNATGGTSSRGQITATLAVSDTFTIDSVNLGAAQDGTRILLKDQTTSAQNGIWTTTISGTSLTLDRATDFDQDVEVTAAAFTFVEEGTTNSDTGWVVTTNDPIIIGGGSGSNITWSQFSGAGQITAGDGLDKTGNTLSLDLKANGGLVIETTELAIDLSATSITGTLAAADGGTGQTSYTTGDILYASGATAISKLADIATGNALISGGVGTAPSYGKIGLTTHVSGTLPVANGGTGTTTLTGLLVGNGTSAVTALKSEYAKTIAPTSTDDGPDGNYSIGSIWCDTTGVRAYICLDTSNDAAVWKEITIDTLQGLVNVDNTADPSDEAKFLRWNDTTNRWIGDYIRGKTSTMTDINSLSPAEGSLFIDSSSKNLVYYDGTNWKNTITATMTNRYNNINTNFSPVVRWLPGDISGSAGSLVWNSSVGSGSINTQGTGAHFVASSVGGKSALYIDPSSATDATKYVVMDLGTTYNGSGDLTIALVIQNPGGYTIFDRLITLLDSTPTTGFDYDNTTNISLFQRTTGNVFRYEYNSSNAIYSPGGVLSTDITTPYVFIMRYTSSGTELKIWLNNTSDTNVHSASLDLDSLAIQNIGLGYYQGGDAYSILRVAEILFWDTPLTNQQITDLSNDLLTEYTVRTSGVESSGVSSLFTAGDGIDITSGTISTDLKANGGLVIESTELAIDLSATSITGTLAATDGGTGQTSYTTGDLLYASGTTAISKLADVATGNALISGGVGTAPSYGKIGLTTHISGTLPVANGGTGATILTGTLIGNGTSAITALKSEFAKTTAPVATDDGPDGGYSIGSLWYDTTNDKGYVCLDTTDNTAVWKETTFVATAGDGIDIAANGTVSTDLKANGGLVIESTELAIDLSASSITGTLAAADGGTGQSSYTTGDILYASGATSISKLADIATGNALISGGVGTAPSYGKIGLTTHVSGTLPVASGGTGTTTFTSGNFLQGNGTSAISATKTVPSGDVVGTTDTQTISNKTLGGNLDANNNKIINLATPTASTDSATKGYVDSVVSGLDVKNSVRLATTQDLDSNGSISGTITYNATGGTSSRGQITATLAVSDTFTIDSVNLGAAQDGTRILLKDQTTQSQNGIWVTTISGTSLTLDRATDFDQDVEVTAAAFTFVEEGTVNSDTGWVVTTNDPITIGGGSGSNIAWSQFSGAGQITAGDGLDKTGNTLSLDLKANGGLVIETTELAIDLSATSITGTLAATDGGTGQSSYTTGDLLYASGSTAISKLADIATGNALISGGVGTAPSYGKIGLTTHVSGTLPVANGGTGATTLTGTLIGNGTSAITALKSEFAKTVDPVATDDGPDGGYSVGSTWLNTTNNRGYICLDTTNDAAIWKSITGRAYTISDLYSLTATNGDTATTTDLRGHFYYADGWRSIITNTRLLNPTTYNYAWLTNVNNLNHIRNRYWYRWRARDFTAQSYTANTLPSTATTSTNYQTNAATGSAIAYNNQTLPIEDGGSGGNKQYLYVNKSGGTDGSVLFKFGNPLGAQQYSALTNKYNGWSIYVVIKDIERISNWGRILCIDSQQGTINGAGSYTGTDYANTTSCVITFKDNTNELEINTDTTGQSFGDGTDTTSHTCVIALIYNQMQRNMKIHYCTYDTTLSASIPTLTNATIYYEDNATSDTLQYIRLGCNDSSNTECSRFKLFEIITLNYAEEDPKRTIMALHNEYKDS